MKKQLVFNLCVNSLKDCNIKINNSLSRKPVTIDDSSMVFFYDGRFKSSKNEIKRLLKYKGNKIEKNNLAENFKFDPKDGAFQLFLTKDFLNQLTQYMLNEKYLDYEINSFPEELSFDLNVASLSNFYPGNTLTKILDILVNYPKETNLKLNLRANTNFIFSPTGVKLNYDLKLDFIYTKNQNVVFSSNIGFEIGLLSVIKENLVNFTLDSSGLSNLNLSFFIPSTYINVDLENLKLMFLEGFKFTLEKTDFKNLLKKPISLPVKRIKKVSFNVEKDFSGILIIGDY